MAVEKGLKTEEAKMSGTNKKERDIDINKVHCKALDDLVNVNSLFTVAVFVGLAYATRGQQSLEYRIKCQAGTGVGKMLVVYEVLAFACFLLSSLVAKVVKLHLYLEPGTSNIKICGIPYNFKREGLDLKDIMLALAATASAVGIVLFTLSVVNIVQIRIGMFSCGSFETRLAVLGLCSIVFVALLIYVVSMGMGIYASIKSDAERK